MSNWSKNLSTTLGKNKKLILPLEVYFRSFVRFIIVLQSASSYFRDLTFRPTDYQVSPVGYAPPIEKHCSILLYLYLHYEALFPEIFKFLA